jgi:AcrR family transcriptional regulator
MPRWDPDARDRLESAALDLFVEQGYDATTVAQIADRAGLTRSTFFRHFADKREVVFGPQDLLADLLTEAVAAAPADLPVRDHIAVAMDRADAVAFTPERHHLAAQRGRIVAENPELQERELWKRARIAAALTAAMESQGVEPFAARIGGELGVLVLTTAFDRWIETGEQRAFGTIAHDVLAAVTDRLTTIAAPG